MIQFPYPGLRPFRKEEKDVFFGREEQIFKLFAKLDKSRFVAVIGPSGCGKSSLVRAGMLPAIELGFLESVGEEWQIAEIRPGIRPMKNLAESLLENWQEKASEASQVAFLLAALERGPMGLVKYLKETSLLNGAGLLILVDQFEEIFRYHRLNIDDAEAFVDLLLASAKQKEVPIYVVITMRSDFLGDCALFPGLPEAMNASQFLTPRLTRNQRRSAIVGPAAMFGGELEPELVTWLLNEMGSDPDQLPLMQHALMRMWTQAGQHAPVVLTLENYERLGGLKNALSNHADEVYRSLGIEQKKIAETLFRCLTERSSEKKLDTRRPVKINEVAKVADVTPEKVREVVKVFSESGRNFLTLSTDSSELVDISHESLIRQWGMLKKWVKNEADSAEHYRRLEKSAVLWIKGKDNLWRTPRLDSALEWEKEQKPNAEWGKRYGTEFDLAIRFLTKAKKNRKLEEIQAEEAYRKKIKLQEQRIKREENERRQKLRLRQKQRLLTCALAALFICSLLAIWAILERGLAQDNLAKNYFYLTAQKFRTDDYAEARQLISKSRSLDKKTAAEYVSARKLTTWYADLMGGTPEQTCGGADAILEDLALSPDGRILATVGEKGAIALFDAESGNLLRRWTAHGGSDINRVVFLPDGKKMVTAGDNRRIILWDVSEGEKLRQWMTPGEVWALAISPDGKHLASSGPDGKVTIRDSETGQKQQQLAGHSAPVNDLAFSSDGTCIASASDDKTARIWNSDSGELLHTLESHTSEVLAVAFHPNGTLLATGSRNNQIRLWNLESGEMTDILKGHRNMVSDLAFSDSGSHLISASYDQTLRVWDTDSRVTLRVLQGHTSAVRGVIARGENVFSVGNDQTLRRWATTSPNMSMARLSGSPGACAISPDGNQVAVGFANGDIELFALPEIRSLWKKEAAHEKDVNQVLFIPDGKFFVSAGFDKAVRLWRTKDGQLHQIFEGHETGTYGIACSPDGRTLATAGRDGQIGMFEIGKEKGRFHPAHQGAITSLAFDSAGPQLLSTGEDGQTQLWNIKTWPPTLLQTFPKSGDALLRAVFSQDNSRIATVGRDTLIRIFNTHSPSKEQTFAGHENTIYDVAFTPGMQVATVSMDATLRLWDMEIGAELFALRLPAKAGHPVPLWDFDFQCTSASNCKIAIPLTSGKLVVYDLQDVF